MSQTTPPVELSPPDQATNPPLAEKQVYGDERYRTSALDDDTPPLERYERTYKIWALNEDRVCLRCREQPDEYRYDRREDFEANRGSRFKLLHRSPETEASKYPTDLELDIIYTLLDEYADQIDGASRTASHKAEGLREFRDGLQRIDFDHVDWETIPNIGQDKAQTLYEAGIATPRDLFAADVDELTALSGIGQGTVNQLRQQYTEPTDQ